MSYLNSLIQKNNLLQLQKIKKNNDEILFLYDLLKSRKNSISHKKIPTFKEHYNFVKEHPYRCWYLIKRQNKYIGSIYALKNNNIGVQLKKNFEKYTSDAINLFLRKHKPLSEIKSLRTGYYTFNISIKDKTLSSILKKMGGKVVQQTFILE